MTLDDFASTMHQLWASTDDEAFMRERLANWQKQSSSSFQGDDIEAFKCWNNDFYKESVQECATRFAIELFQLCALCKHKGFQEECEWRLVLPIDPKRKLVNTTRKFRPRNGARVPYIETKLTFDAEPNLPLTQVMLGPCYDGQLPVVERLDSRGKIPVTRSDIPYNRFDLGRQGCPAIEPNS